MDFIIFNRICCEAGPCVSNFVVLENEGYDFFFFFERVLTYTFTHDDIFSLLN